ncbi:hypothetical protein [Burkholderia guangdongensis]|uniref:hypothetical protein n=1 Tax=Burkholderia guangdongensis TaxID=1792500 RepID=UPI0015CDB180|nr:hypothetical protein [Burkholderia guangdongensis]
MRTYVGKLMLWAMVLVGGVALSGCSVIYPPVGATLTHYANDHVVPEVLASNDVDISTCGTGAGLHQLLESFERVVHRPHIAMMDTELLSGYCAQARANEAHLMYLQALHDGQANRAKDFHIVEQRLQKLTAQRRYAAYHDFVAAYDHFGDAHACPRFRNDQDQAEYLVGLITTVQALLSDIQAGSVVGVPQDVANRAARSSACLDNAKWWGMPEAIRAAAWMSVPGTAPAGTDPQTVMDHAVETATPSGMPLAATFAAIAAYGHGDTAREQEAIRQFVAIDQQNKVPKKYALLGEIGRLEATYYSDQIWMKATGARTPYEGLGRFPNDSASGKADDTGDLLK